MKVSGTAVLHGPAEKVYAVLNDPAVLVRTIPGCERLEQVGPDSYKATISAGVASIKGSFSGEVHLSDQRPPHSLVLHAAGAGTPGTVSADVKVTLTDNGDGTTLLSYDADAVVGGMIGGVGQRVLTSVAKKTAGEFFTAVDAVLRGEEPAAPAAVGAAPSPAPATAAQPAPSVPLGSSAQPESGGQPQAGAQPAAAQPQATPAVYTRPAAPPAPVATSGRDLLLGLGVGAGVTLLGALVGGLRPSGEFALGLAAGGGIALLGALVGGLLVGRVARRR